MIRTMRGCTLVVATLCFLGASVGSAFGRTCDGLRGRVVRPHSPGALGASYGPYAFRLRNARLGLDFVIGHVLKVYVHPGDRVARGTLIARASDQGAPDGCHLHSEVRPAGAVYAAAVAPASYLHLRQVG